jgi:hypothetical protein
MNGYLSRKFDVPIELFGHPEHSAGGNKLRTDSSKRADPNRSGPSPSHDRRQRRFWHSTPQRVPLGKSGLRREDHERAARAVRSRRRDPKTSDRRRGRSHPSQRRFGTLRENISAGIRHAVAEDSRDQMVRGIWPTSCPSTTDSPKRKAESPVTQTSRLRSE